MALSRYVSRSPWFGTIFRCALDTCDADRLLQEVLRNFGSVRYVTNDLGVQHDAR